MATRKATLILTLLVLLTCYAPVELTRYIFAYGITGELMFELGFMWLFYLVGMGIIFKLIRSKTDELD